MYDKIKFQKVNTEISIVSSNWAGFITWSLLPHDIKWMPKTMHEIFGKYAFLIAVWVMWEKFSHQPHLCVWYIDLELASDSLA